MANILVGGFSWNMYTFCVVTDCVRWTDPNPRGPGAKVSGCPWCERRGAKVEAGEMQCLWRCSMGFYSDLMGFYSDLLGYEWDVPSGND